MPDFRFGETLMDIPISRSSGSLSVNHAFNAHAKTKLLAKEVGLTLTGRASSLAYKSFSEESLFGRRVSRSSESPLRASTVYLPAGEFNPDTRAP